MQFMRLHIFLAVATLSSAPAFAWEHSFSRGLDLYSATDGRATIRLVCDPNRVYGGTETMMLIVLGGNSDLNTNATLTFPSGETITAPLVHSRLSKRDLDDEVWQPLLDGLRNAARVELSVGANTQTVDLGEPVAFSCI